jgi:predicted nucleic acid-binding protein
MILVDTSVLIDAFINQNPARQQIARRSLEQVIEEQALLLSPLILTEFSFVLSKLHLFQQHQNTLEFLDRFVNHSIDKEMLNLSLRRAQQMGSARNINDLMHLAFAERFCNKLISFDSDFKKLQKFTDFEIEILTIIDTKDPF